MQQLFQFVLRNNPLSLYPESARYFSFSLSKAASWLWPLLFSSWASNPRISMDRPGYFGCNNGAVTGTDKGYCQCVFMEQPHNCQCSQTAPPVPFWMAKPTPSELRFEVGMAKVSLDVCLLNPAAGAHNNVRAPSMTPF